MTSLVVQTVKHLPTMWETWVQSLSWEDPLEKEMATDSSILAWKIPWMEERSRVQSMGLQRDTTEQLHFHVQSLSRARLFATPWTTARQASLSITNTQSSPRLTSIESVMPSNHLIFCSSLLLLPSIFPSIRVFSDESALHQVAKVLEFQLQHQSFQWTPRIDLL